MVERKYANDSFEEGKWNKETGDANIKNEMQLSDIGINDENELDFLRKTDKTNDTLVLYASLDDKNRTIQALKQRLMNQQLQLAYYLHKNLGNNHVLEFSAQCVPQLTEENLQLSLAMYKFVKDSGGKNKLTLLHEKLHEYDKKVTNLLNKQEELVKTASKHTVDEEILKNAHVGCEHSDRACRLAQLDLCNKIMNATVQVKTELEELRMYSEKVVQLETERNALVDYVFSLPSEQRLAGLNLIENIKTGKHLTKEDLTEDQKCLGYQLTEVLSTMENEASSLVSLTEEQKLIYNDELEKLKLENTRLSELLKATTECSNQYKIFELEEKCNSIEKDLEEVRKGLETEVTDKDNEILKLSEELKLAIDQAVQLEDQIAELRNSVDSVVSENEMLQETLNDMMKINPDEEAKKDDNLQEIVESQKEQIKNLMQIICNLNDTCDNVMTMNKDNNVHIDALSYNVKEGDYEEEIRDSGLVSSERAERKADEYLENADYNTECNDFSQVMSRDSENKGQSKSSTRTNQTLTNQPTSNHASATSLRKSRVFNGVTEKMTTTSLQVESFDHEGRRECMKAILESSLNMEGVLEMDNSSKLRLRLQCTSPDRSKTKLSTSRSVLTLHNKDDSNKTVGISEQLSSIKVEMDKTLKDPEGRKDIITNIKKIYSQLFGNKYETKIT